MCAECSVAAHKKARQLRRALKESVMRLRIDAKPEHCLPKTPRRQMASGQYRISNIKYAVSIMAVTLATESTKASRASW
jgi:hypothetical protein